MNEKAPLRVVVALRCEAQPLIERFALSAREAGGPLRYYAGTFDGTPLELVIGGVGKLAAATAAAYLQGLDAPRSARWLNVGLAGHGRRGLGEVMLAGRVSEAASGRRFSVELPFDTQLPMVTLRTVDAPEARYPEDDEAVEMEAFGFFSAARRFAGAEAVHALKIVSDNATSPPLGRDEARAKALVEGALDSIVEVVKSLAKQGKSG